MPIDTCNVVGVWTDSTGTPRAATIEVVADSYFYDDSTTPDSVIFPSPVQIEIDTDGVVDFDLPVSEPYNVSYTFKITPATVSSLQGGFIEFKASIPNQASVELASLMPTPYTQDRSVTGALRIAKEMLSNPVTLPYIVDGLNIIRQSSTPGTPTGTNPIWINTATGMIYTWDSVNTKWQSEVQWQPVGSSAISSTSSFSVPLLNISGSTQAKISHAIVRWSVGATPHDGSNRWSIQPRYKVASSATRVNIGSAILSTSGSYAVGNVGESIINPGTLIDMDEAEFLEVAATKTGSPENLQVSVTYGIRYFA